jgi:toluene monooxygenase electron transfer component
MESTIEVRSAGESRSFACAPGERLLDAALRAGLNLSYGCATGICGDCRAKLVSGEVESLWADAPGARVLRQPGEVLLCQTSALGPCVIEALPDTSTYLREAPQDYVGVLDRIVPNDDGLAWIELELDRPMRFLAGQFVLLSMPGVKGYRAYSPAHDGQDVSRLSLVVRNKSGGELSPLLCSRDSVSRRVHVFGPLGAAHVRPKADGDLTLVVGGSGAAVALSVLDWAVASGHLERHGLDLVCGMRTSRCPEVIKRLGAAAAHHADRLRIIVALSDEDSRTVVLPGVGALLEFESGMAHEVAQRCLEGRWKDRAVFVAGPPPMVQSTLRMLVTKARLKPSEIRYDSFT